MRNPYFNVTAVLFFVILGGISSAQTVSSLELSENPHSVLSALVSFEVLGAQSGAEVRVRYETEGDAGETPAYPVTEGAQEVAVLGLLPETTYDMTVEVSGSSEGTSRTESFTTSSLPEPLQNVTIETTGESPEGYTLVETFLGPKFVFAFDGDGRVRWYKDFTDEPRGFETKIQPNGNFTTFVGLSFGFEPTYGKFVEYTPSGEEVRTYSAQPPYYTDSHELLLTTNESGEVEHAHFFSYDLQPIAEAPPIGGEAGTRTAGHQLLRQTPDGQNDFFWNAWDHFEPADWIEPRGSEEYEDFDHPNSLDIDEDGNYIVSMRSFGAVLKLNAKTGDLLWQLGGRKNQFEIVNDPLNGFSAQHTAYMTDAGTLLILDNGARHDPQQSRAVEYELDLEAMTATMVWEFRPEGIYSPIVSSAERLQNGNTLVGFGIPSQIYEIDAEGETVWEAAMTHKEGEVVAGEEAAAGEEASNSVPFYRANRLLSLYEFRVP